MYYRSSGSSVKEELRLQDIWTGGRTDKTGWFLYTHQILFDGCKKYVT
mgnify:CR=1 FL=1